jgi:hypothetical protein
MGSVIVTMAADVPAVTPPELTVPHVRASFKFREEA